jgi:hypothetical protein
MNPMSGSFFRSVVPDDGHELPDIDTSVAHQARVYDYLLGGKDNFAADREVGEKILLANPDMVIGSRANRAFLGRVVRFMAGEAGIRQFLLLAPRVGRPRPGTRIAALRDCRPEAVMAAGGAARADYPVATLHPAGKFGSSVITKG